MGIEGLTNLAKFVQEGGTLITEGSTTTIFPAYAITSGVTVETPAQLFVRGSILRGKWTDLKSPLAYGYEGTRSAGLLQPVAGAERGRRRHPAGVRGVRRRRRRRQRGPGPEHHAQRAAAAPVVARAGAAAADAKPQADAAAEFRRMAAQFGVSFDDARPRVVLSFPQNPNDMLLSGTLANGQFLSNRAALVDVPLGKGHVVMFAIRPFWRWQTQGTYSLGFNAIMNWNDLDAGKSDRAADTLPPGNSSSNRSRALSISAIAASNFASVDARWLLVCSFRHSGSSLT